MAMEAGWRALQFTTKAIDAYMKTLLVDKVTTDEEKPAPVYLLDELSEILRSSSIDLIQEIVEYTFRRLRHRSPLVKTKVYLFVVYIRSLSSKLPHIYVCVCVCVYRYTR